MERIRPVFGIFKSEINRKAMMIIGTVSLLLTGCAGTEYMSHIKDVPFNVEDAYRQPVVQNVPSNIRNSSIWRGDKDFYNDQRASRIGDIITVKIAEATQANEKATTDLKRTGADVYLGVPNFLGLETNNYPSSINPASMIRAHTKNDFKGEGETTRNGSVISTMSAKVIEVMPNGNLAIEGKREVTLNNERKEFLIHGIVRQKDIAADNSVFSSQVADAKVILTGVGVISEKQRPGWLARIIDLVWPF